MLEKIIQKGIIGTALVVGLSNLGGCNPSSNYNSKIVEVDKTIAKKCKTSFMMSCSEECNAGCSYIPGGVDLYECIECDDILGHIIKLDNQNTKLWTEKYLELKQGDNFPDNQLYSYIK